MGAYKDLAKQGINFNKTGNFHQNVTKNTLQNFLPITQASLTDNVYCQKIADKTEKSERNIYIFFVY